MLPPCRTKSCPEAYRRTPALESLEARSLFATIAVANLDDGGDGSLRAAIASATAGDTIDLGALTGTLTLASELRIDKNLILTGPGPDALMISGNAASRVFHIDPGLDVSISRLRVEDGYAPAPISQFSTDYGNGAGIWVDGGIDSPRNTLTLDNVVIDSSTANEFGGGLAVEFTDLTLTQCRFTGNTAAAAIAALGGGVAVVQDSTVTASDCTFDHNTAHATGSGTDPYNTGSETTALGGGVALLGAGASSFTNCTFADNAVTADVYSSTGSTATAFGGGLLVGSNGNLTILNCTISSNTANGTGADGTGGGAAVFEFGTSNPDGNDVLKLVNTIIAGNTASNHADAYGFDISLFAVANYKNNVLGVAEDSGITVGTNGNRGGTADSPLDAKLGILSANGGPVPTMMPEAGSPVLGVAAASETTRRDARGFPRSVAYDVGAVERQSNYSPGLEQGPVTYAATDVPYLSVVNATDVDGDPIGFLLSGAPGWLNFVDNHDGTATLSGTPTAIDAGDSTMTLVATDGDQSWFETFTLSTSVTPTLLTSDGMLKVAGTNDAEVIKVWQPRGAGSAIRVVIGNRTYNFSAELVKAVQIFGLGGDDTVVGNCVDLGVYINAGDGNDTVVGTALPDTLTAGAGDDSVYGMAGDDWMDGNGGRDNLIGGDGDDRVYGGNGGDTLDGGAGRDVLYGEVGSNLYITRDRNRDWVFATDATTNFVQGDADRDQLYNASYLPEVVASKPRRR
jgi:hypothetical protein